MISVEDLDRLQVEVLIVLLVLVYPREMREEREIRQV
jgi:hypothetical protein